MFRAITARWLALVAGVFAVILVPFFMFQTQIEALTDNFLHSASAHSALVAVVLSSLLASDILLPIPSSIVSTATGFFLGFAKGTIVSLIGMTVSCMLGYWLAGRLGHPVAGRVVGNKELERLQNLYSRFGDWVIVVCRPVPVLAEASVLFAGIGRMPVHRFLLLSTLSNLGISAVYAAVGVLSATVNSFLLAFSGAILVSLVAMVITKEKK